MNRAQRRALGLGGGSAVTLLRCSGCGLEAVHVEVWVGDDDPHGLPPEYALCECGDGWLLPVEPKRSPPFGKGRVMP